LPLGAELLVGSASRLAMAAGIGEEVIGLTAVAVGTSLPEIAAAVISAVRKHAAITLGNLIGSNIFNVLAVGGAFGVSASLAGNATAPPPYYVVDTAVMLLAVGVIAGLTYLRVGVSRIMGGILVLAYCGYAASLFFRG
jgi:cation:H+ antiporter